jgi:type I restriction enzyme S subunit
MKKYSTIQLRFPEFKETWERKTIKDILSRISIPVDEKEIYRQIGIRSHGKGLFYKEGITGKELGNKRVFWIKENALIINIVFAWERAISKTTTDEIGMIASHRFPMYHPIDNKAQIDYLLHFFLTQKGKHLLELASPGGAGRNKTLGQREFENLTFAIPSIQEQQKIASFLSAADKKIEQLHQKKQLLEQYKKSIVQKLLSQQVRFKDDNKKEFQNWDNVQLKDILFEHREKNPNEEIKEVFSVAKHKGVINQIEHLGRSYAGKDTSKYKAVYPNDIIYTKSPTSDFPFGIIKQNKTNREGIVSTLYGVFRPKNKNIGLILDTYFATWQNTYNYLNPLVQKGAKNTMNINNEDFLNGSYFFIPSNEKEQIKIANFLTALDGKINIVSRQLDSAIAFKKGLLQQMFV